MSLFSLFDPLVEFGEWVGGRKVPKPKKETALRFGILGAAGINLVAFIVPARSHPEVIVAAVAARDKKRAEEYAKRYDIPIVHENYDALIDDPSINCVYIPLPNGLHYPWALKALKAGKHVLLEKPSVSNAEEARSLFRHPILQGSNAPVLVEASHYRFHPAWHFFLSLFSSADVEEVYVAGGLPGSALSKTDIRFLYPLAGGACMDFGHYAISCMRGVFGAEPTRVVSATPRLVPEGFDQRCDEAMEATYEFPNGGTGRILVDLATRGGYWFPWLTGNWPRLKDLPPWVSVKLKETRDGEKSTRKEIVLSNFMGPHMWHKIEVTTTETWRDASGVVVKSETHKESHTAYTWPEGTAGQSRGEPYWSTYRYQLEEFVNRVKGRQGSGKWIDGEESIRQMEVNDKTYEKAGMLVRPTCEALEKGV